MYPPPPSSRKVCADPVAKVTESQLAEIDPKGERKALFDYRRNPRSVKPGDIVRVTFKNGDPFNGVVLSIKLRGIDTSFLLRNELTRVAVEMSVKVFNPNVQSVEIVQRAERKARRARLYYMRCVYTRALTADINGPLYLLLISPQDSEARPPQCREYRDRLCPPKEGFPGWQQTAAVERGPAQSILHIWDVLLSVYMKFHHIVRHTNMTIVIDLVCRPLDYRTSWKDRSMKETRAIDAAKLCRPASSKRTYREVI